jgi:hypothetical protein
VDAVESSVREPARGREAESAQDCAVAKVRQRRTVGDKGGHGDPDHEADDNHGAHDAGRQYVVY